MAPDVYQSKIRGGKGGDAPPSPRPPVEDKNTLQSRATGRVLYALGEGPFEGIIGGYANGAKNIYLNGTPLMNQDGTLNFQGVTWDYRTGTPDQSWIPGFPAVENTHSGDVGLPVEIKRSSPAIRSITNTNANAVRVVIAVGSMVDQNATTGDAKGTRVDFTIRVRRQGRAGWEAEYPQAIIGKTMSTYEEQYRIPLPGDGPWDIQVERLTPDSDRATLRNDTTWSSYTEIIDRKLRYPNTALLALTFNAQTFGNSMPTVTSRWNTWIVRVPSNYNPVTREYLGVWNGGWKLAFTSNPAYLFMALLTHRAGCNLPDSAVDMAAVYTCGRYCDELVPSGLKNITGGDIMEPRFEAHFVHNTRQEAYAIINALASAFRAMAYWAAGQVTVVQDAPRDPLFAVNATQTIGGFEFSGPAIRAIKTVALVSFQNPDDLDKSDLEVYEDFDLIKKYGWQPESITAFACKSRGQARRLGKWFIETNKLGDALTYKTSIDHLHAGPGDVIVMTEKSVVGADLGGRIISATKNRVQLDRNVTIEVGKVYTLHVQLPDGTVGTRRITTGPGTGGALTLQSDLAYAPYPEASWVIEVSDLRPRKFRIMGVSDDGDLEYSVAAVPYDDTIYARVERGLNIKLPPVSKLPNPGIVAPPSNVRVDRQYISTPSGWTTALELSWDASPDPYIKNYTIRYRRDNGNFDTLTDVAGTTKTIYGESSGRFLFHVQAVNIGGVESRPAILEIFIPDNSPITLIRPSGLELENQGNNTIFQGRDPVFVWRGTAVRGSYDLGQEPAVGAGYLDAIFRDYEIRVYDTRNNLVFTDHTPIPRYLFGFDVNSQTTGGPHRAFRFEVVMRDRWGNYSLPASLEVSNPAPAQVTSLEVQGGYGSIFINFDDPEDLDFAGTLVWMGETSGVAPGPATVAYDGPNRYIFLQVPPNVDRYIRVACYDSFGKTGLNVSAEVKVRSVGVVPSDTVPPGVPTGLALTDDVQTAPDGTQTYLLKATWTANSEGDLLGYAVEIAVENGNFLHYQTNVPRYEWQVQPGVRYRVRLAAFDKDNNTSIFSPEITYVVRGDDEPPPAPTGLVTEASFKSIWVKWDQHPAPDFSHMEIYEAAVNDRAQAQYVANAAGTTFLRENLPGGTERWYWIRAVDRSRNKSDFFPTSLTAGISARTRKIEEADYAELSIGRAVIMDGAIDNAKIANLDAGKIIAGSIMSGEVILGSTGQTIQQATAGNSDPAAAINTGTTRILPGKITLSGSTTLQNVLYGPDQTQINGGAIATNTISANKLSVGARGVELSGVEFTAKKELNQVHWTAGSATYAGSPLGTVVTRAVPAASADYFGQTLYIFYDVNLSVIGSTTDQTYFGYDHLAPLGTYNGADKLFINYGRTIIDGAGIRASTITGDRIAANTITSNLLSTQKLITAAAQIDNGLINSAHIGNAQINSGHINSMSFDKLTGGTMNAQYVRVGDTTPGYGFIDIESRTVNNTPYRQLRYWDSANIVRVQIGNSGANPPNRILDGLYVRNERGEDILTANGLGVTIVGTDNVKNGATSGMTYGPTWNITRVSEAGGNTVIQAYAEATFPNSLNGLARITANGVTKHQANVMAGPFFLMAVDVPARGAAVNYRVEMLFGNIWLQPGNPTMTIVEYKK